MKRALVVVSWLAIVWLLTAAVLVFTGAFDLDRAKLHLLLATVSWFATAPWWMAREQG